MDAVEYLKTIKRMCKLHKPICWGEDNHTPCELRIKANAKGMSCSDYTTTFSEEAVAIVEKWAKEHPRKTRQEKFLEMFPKTNVDANNVITICPYETCIGYKCDLKWGESTESKCRECRKKYWLEEVE